MRWLDTKGIHSRHVVPRGRWLHGRS
jgi:hypothetical protein